MDKKEIEKRFTYHPPRSNQIQRYEYIRDWAKWLALQICDMTPESREQSLAITALEECVMWANAAIARNETPGRTQPDPNTLYPDVLTTSQGNSYTFTYDLPEGKRGQQDILAASLEDAFNRFGWVMNEFKLHPSNISYTIDQGSEGSSAGVMYLDMAGQPHKLANWNDPIPSEGSSPPASQPEIVSREEFLANWQKTLDRMESKGSSPSEGE